MRTYQLTIEALGHALKRANPRLVLDRNGYVDHWSKNLLAGTNPQWFDAELKEGDGKELAGKFRAAHSSSALAVNTFARFKTACEALSIESLTGWPTFRFEAKCSAGIRRKNGGESPPNLDLLAEGAG